MFVAIRYLFRKLFNRSDSGENKAVVPVNILESEVERIMEEEDQENHVSQASADGEEEEEKQENEHAGQLQTVSVGERDLCQYRVGVITDLLSDYGLINGELKFNFSGLNVDCLSCGMKVQYVASRKSTLEEWHVNRVLLVEEDWDADPEREEEPLTTKKVDTINRNEVGIVTEVNGNNVCVERGGEVPDIKFSLDSLQSTYVPVKGDWLSVNSLVEVDDQVQDFGGKILDVYSIKPVRSKAAAGHVSHWDEKEHRGSIDKTVWFTEDVCAEGYKPTVGDHVAFEGVECSYSVFSWRAVGVCVIREADVEGKAERHASSSAHIMDHPKEQRTREQGISSGPTKVPEEDSVRGIWIDKNLNFGVVARGQMKNLDVTIWNKGTLKHHLIRGRFHGKKSESQLTTIGFEEDIVLNPGCKFTFQFQCRGKFLGLTTETFVFTFRGFRIARRLEVDVQDPYMMNLITVDGTYKKGKQNSYALARERRAFVKQASFVRGIAPLRPPAFLPLRLDSYEVPEAIWNAVLGDKDNVNDNNVVIERLEAAIPSLKDDLEFGSYCSNMHTLLYLEEIAQTIALQRFNMENVEFTYAGPGREYLVIQIPGLAERRPSVLVGDRLMAVDPSQPDTVYEGFVHRICFKDVWLKFGSNFHIKYDGGPRSVSFIYGRTPMRRMHAAVEFAMKNLGSNFLFPTSLKLQKPQLNVTGRETEERNSFLENSSDKWKGTSSARFSERQVGAGGYEKEEGAVGGSCQLTAPKACKKPKSVHWFNSSLNHFQKLAVLNALGGEARPLPYVIFGPPGTGKTVTLVETILQIYDLIPESRILVTTPSNSSANLIALRLLGSKVLLPGDLVRLVAYHLLDDDSLLPEALRPYATTADLSKAAANQVVPLSRKLQPSSNASTIGRHRITVTTCISAGQLWSLGFSKGHFTHVCVDEAGQASEPEIMIPLALLHEDWGQAILAGDPQQLGPVVTSNFAKHFKFGISFLDRLLNRYPYARDPCGFTLHCGFNPYLVTRLVMNYRSLPEILSLPSSLFYDDDLEPQVSDKNSQEAVILKSLAAVLPKRKTLLPPALVFHGVRGTNYQENDSPSWFNPQELVQVVHYLMALNRLGITSGDIGVITPYQKQVHKLRELVSQFNVPMPKIGSVEEFQGQERLVIILSAVRSSPNQLRGDIIHALGFVANRRRLNVALTRARALLIIVGNPWLLSRDPHWKQTLLYCLDQDAYTGCDVPPNFLDFSFESPPADFDLENL